MWKKLCSMEDVAYVQRESGRSMGDVKLALERSEGNVVEAFALLDHTRER